MFDIENRLEARDVQVRSDNSPPASTEPSPGIVFGLKAAAIGIAGGLLTGVAMVAALETGLSEPASYALQVIPVNEVDTAAQSLIAAKAVDLVSDAKACRQPLAYLLVRAIGAPSGAVRIRSGSYVSPNLKLETQVERIAIPFSGSLSGRFRANRDRKYGKRGRLSDTGLQKRERGLVDPSGSLELEGTMLKTGLGT